MCGIAGIWSKNGDSALLKPLEGMCNAMHHRGPDDEGYVSFNSDQFNVYFGKNSMEFRGVNPLFDNCRQLHENLSAQSSLALGFKRLSIIDLSAQAHQPMTDSTGRFWMVFNGEIYNYRELRDELMSLGHNFNSSSDSEVALKSYMQWGEKCLQKFNGMFALAVYDRNSKQIFLARDRIGIKPLYYFNQDDYFLFGSSIKAILSSGLVPAEIDEWGLQQNFMFGISQRPQTAFKNIKALAPSTYMIVDQNSGRVAEHKYWDLPIGQQDFSMTEKSALRLMDEVLNKAVEYRLVADVEVGTFMSGGIDSTLISAIAGRHQKGIKAFTLGVDERYGDINEIHEAAANAKLNKLDHVVGIVNPETILENLQAVIEGYEEPYHHLPVNFLISQLVQQNGLKVVLNGLGGDELFAGYDAYSKLGRWEKIKMLPKFGKLLPEGVHQKADKLKKFSGIRRIDEYYAHYYSTFQDNDIDHLFAHHEADVASIIHDRYNADDKEFTDDVEALSYFNLRSYIGSHHVRTIDQFTMHHSIEGRFPMLDHEFVELAFKVPTRLKLHNGKQKYILRKLAKNYIAPECLNMKKRGFSLPLRQMLKTELQDITDQSIRQLKTRALLNPDAIDTIVKAGDSAKVWHLVMTELWCKHYLDRKWA